MQIEQENRYTWTWRYARESSFNVATTNLGSTAGGQPGVCGMGWCACGLVAAIVRLMRRVKKAPRNSDLGKPRRSAPPRLLLTGDQ